MEFDLSQLEELAKQTALEEQNAQEVQQPVFEVVDSNEQEQLHINALIEAVEAIGTNESMEREAQKILDAMPEFAASAEIDETAEPVQFDATPWMDALNNADDAVQRNLYDAVRQITESDNLYLILLIGTTSRKSTRAYLFITMNVMRVFKESSLYKRLAANQPGKELVIRSIGKRLLVPTSKKYMGAFTTSVTSCPALFKADVENGKVLKKEPALTIPTPIVMGFAKAAQLVYEQKGITADGIIIKFPDFLNELKIDIKDSDSNHKGRIKVSAPDREETGGKLSQRAAAREAYYWQIMQELDSIWGKLPNTPEYLKLITIQGYNPETEECRFNSPYIWALIKGQDEEKHDAIISGEKYFIGTTDLLHSSVANEKNPAAVEIATRILVGVQKRGNRPDYQEHKNKNYEDKRLVTWDITCKGLVSECPQIRERLKAQKTTTLKTQVLRRTFTAVYRILKEKTDLYNFYTDVFVTETIPTATTLNTDRITVAHHGGNPHYKKPLINNE